MGTHTIDVTYTDKKRYSNDPQYHADDETHIVDLLCRYWNTENTQSIEPSIGLTEADTTHDLTKPKIIVFSNNTISTGFGLDYTAKRLEKTITLRIMALDRGLLHDVIDETVRILDFCRKRPIDGWDFLYTEKTDRVDARAGNYKYTLNITLFRLCKPFNELRDAVVEYTTPVADFTATPLSGTAPLTVSFSDTSTNDPTSWRWDFGNDDMSDSQNPTYMYTHTGTFSVSLTVRGPGGSDTITKTSYITVEAGDTPPSAPLTPRSSLVDAGSNIELSWTVPSTTGSSPISYYTIYRTSVYGGTMTQIGTTSNTHYIDDTLVSGTPYYYKISATNESGEGDLSETTASLPVNTSALYYLIKDVMGDTTYNELLGLVKFAGKDREDEFLTFCRSKGVSTDGEMIFALLEYEWNEIRKASTRNSIHITTFEAFKNGLETDLNITPLNVVEVLQSLDGDIYNEYPSDIIYGTTTYIDSNNPDTNYYTSEFDYMSSTTSDSSHRISLIKIDGVSSITESIGTMRLCVNIDDINTDNSQNEILVTLLHLTSGFDPDIITYNDALSIDGDYVTDKYYMSSPETEFNYTGLISTYIFSGFDYTTSDEHYFMLIPDFNDNNYIKTLSNESTVGTRFVFTHTTPIIKTFHYNVLGDALSYAMDKL